MTKKRMKVLIGYDGSSDANAAIDDLVHAGLPQNVEALIVSVSDSPTVAPFAGYDLIDQTMVGDRVRSLVSQSRTRVSEAANRTTEIVMNADIRLRSIFPSWEVRGAIMVGNPAAELVRKAEHWHADLIVVGSQGLSAISRLILGSVSLKVSTEAHCTVRIGRQPIRTIERDQLRILVGLNCSASAEKALRQVLARPWTQGTELRIVAVDDGVSTITTDSIIASTQHAGEYHSVVEGKFVKLAESRGLLVTAGIKKGEPEQVLITEAHDWEADCIVVGSRGTKTSSWALFDRSVSAALAAHAPCSVEIVR